MESLPPTDNAGPFGAASKRLASRIFIIFENRLQLAMVEVQEERERVLCAITTALVAGIFGLLAGIGLTIAVVVAFQDYHPLIALLLLIMVYLGGAAFYVFKLIRLQRNWQSLPATIEQLKKDRECLEKLLK